MTQSRFAPSALMLGNLVTGVTVLAPAGMLADLATGLGVAIRDTGLLITFGAAALCIGSPVTAWLTSRFDRRQLLAVTLLIMALGNAASALIPDYGSLLAIRILMLAVAALFTPQAASVVGMIVPPAARSGAISYVFLGWSLAAALGLPLITFTASHFGWRFVFGGTALVALISAMLLVWRLPAGLAVVPVDLRSWIAVGRNRLIVVLLLITMTQMAGQFAVFTFMGPLLAKLTGAGPNAIGLTFGVFGVCGFLGNLLASRVVIGWGAFRTSVVFMILLVAGILLWAGGTGHYSVMTVGVGIWGLGFASTNSMQQARLVAAAPDLAAVSVSLNTSVLYIGQAIGSALGAALFVHERFGVVGFAGVVLTAAALAMVIGTSRLERALA